MSETNTFLSCKQVEQLCGVGAFHDPEDMGGPPHNMSYEEMVLHFRGGNEVMLYPEGCKLYPINGNEGGVVGWVIYGYAPHQEDAIRAHKRLLNML